MDNDIIDISMDFDNLDNHWDNKKTNFGGGIELLMNDKKSESHGPTSDIDIEDLNNLENELNDLAAETSAPMPNTFESGLFGIKSNLDDKPSVSFNEEPSIRILGVEQDDPSSNLGSSTANTSSDAKTWDGYGKFNNVPINPDSRMSSEPKLSKDEMLREKFKYLRKLEALEKKGIELVGPTAGKGKREIMAGAIMPIQDRKMVKALFFDKGNVDEETVDLVVKMLGKESARVGKEIMQMELTPEKITAPVYVLGFDIRKIGMDLPVDLNKVLAEELKAKDYKVIEPGGHDYMLERNWQDFAQQFEVWISAH